jgi:hypothetical protein
MGFRNPITTLVDQTARDAAAAAQSSANNALAVASARNHVFVQSNAPTTTTLDDLWINPANGYQIRSWDGSSWQPVAFGTAAIAAQAITADLVAAGAIGAGAIAAGAITADKLTADAINGKTITGVDVATGAAGTARVHLYESVNAHGAPMGVVELDNGRAGDTPARVTMDSGAGGASLTIDGGTYGGKALPVLKFTSDGFTDTASLTVPLSALQAAGISWVSGFIADYGAGFMPSQVRLMADGRVQLSGVVKNVNASAIAVTSVIGTLPSWAAPTSGTVILGLISNAGLMHVDVGTDAKLRLQTSLPSGAWISLTSTYVPA